MFRLERRACNAAEGFALLFLAWFLVVPVWAFPFAADYWEQAKLNNTKKIHATYIGAPWVLSAGTQLYKQSGTRTVKAGTFTGERRGRNIVLDNGQEADPTLLLVRQ